MRILGLTGSVAMGKSTAAKMLRRSGVPVFDADAAVHRLLDRHGGAVEPIRALFPDAVTDGRVDRAALGAHVFGNAQALARLEAVVHPLVAQSRAAFFGRHARRRSPLVVADIPLLFETAGDRWCDAVVVVSAPAFLQRGRLLRRPGMTPARLAAILALQMPDWQKRQRATYVVPSGLGLAVTQRHLQRILAEERRKSAGHWPPWASLRQTRWTKRHRGMSRPHDEGNRSRHRNDGA